MMRFILGFIILSATLSVAFAQDPGYDKVAQKCGSSVQWAADDPWRPEDGVPEAGTEEDKPKVDRVELLRDAQKKAHETHRLILWFVFRVAGSQMYRAPIPERYLMQVLFTDPELVELINRRFVPIRLFADPAIGKVVKIKALDFVEPGLVFMDADGMVVHKVDRIRSFNADWFLTLLTGVLKASGHDKVEGDAEAKLLAGDYEGAELALQGSQGANQSYLRAQIKRRTHEADKALALLQDAKDAPFSPLVNAERGLILLRQGKLDDAKAALEASAKTESARQAEAGYNLAVIARLQGRDADALKLLAGIVQHHADSAWGWRAAACLNTSKDTTPDAALMHSFEDPFFAPAAGPAPAADTCWKRAPGDINDVARRAVAFLLMNQREDGSWSDTRYAYWPDASILPNTRVAITSLACAALRAWRELDPERIDSALARGEPFALDEKHMNRFKNEEVYADAYKILMLARKFKATKDTAFLKAMETPVKSLEMRQQRDGFWAHEYPNPFCTAAVLQCLEGAKACGAPIPEKVIAKGADALTKIRLKDGSYPYDSSGRAGNNKDAMARMPACEAALLAAGNGKPERLFSALENWWKTLERFKVVRRNDFHSDGELAGFFFFHGIFHTSEGLYLLDAKSREANQAKFIELLASIPEIDGSFLDSHEMGKSYGTAMALLTLRNVTPKK